MIAAIVLFSLSLMALAIIDYQQQILPDRITLPLLWLGLFINLGGLFCSAQSAIIGALVGYGSLWLLAWIFYQTTGKEGMGHGDFKLFAVLGAWLGWQLLPFIILIASILGTLVGVVLIGFKKHERQMPMAFGPYLAIAGWIGLIWGQTLKQMLF